jgi:hypothetical protein
MARSLVALLAIAAVSTIATISRAEPQGNAGLTIGLAGRGYDREIWDETAFHLGVRGDVLFGRTGVGDFGVGPYVEVFTHAFDEIQFGGGASLLVPVIDFLPMVVSAGAYGRHGDDGHGLEPGIAGQLFWGSRSYNFHANYVMAFGLLGQLRWGLGDSRETAVVIAAQLDIAAMSLPFIFLVEAARGGSADAAPIE